MRSWLAWSLPVHRSAAGVTCLIRSWVTYEGCAKKEDALDQALAVSEKDIAIHSLSLRTVFVRPQCVEQSLAGDKPTQAMADKVHGSC
jgi:hypothetical protein